MSHQGRLRGLLRHEANSSTGIEGIGGEQTDARFGSITQANNPEISFSDVEHDAPEAKNSAWAGTGIVLDITSGTHKYQLIYFNQWTGYESTYTKTPVDTKTVKYMMGKTRGHHRLRVPVRQHGRLLLRPGDHRGQVITCR